MSNKIEYNVCETIDRSFNIMEAWLEQDIRDVADPIPSTDEVDKALDVLSSFTGRHLEFNEEKS